MISKKKIVFILAALFLLTLKYSPTTEAMRNRFKGILPPQRLQQQEVTEVVEVEEIKPTYPDLKMRINIPARKVTLYDEGKEVARYDVAVGQPVFKTPAGPQTITRIVWNPSWIPPNSPWARGEAPQPPGPRNCLGPVKMIMGDGIRLHGTNTDSSVGRAASHGCLRMHNSEARKLAWYIQKRMNLAEEELLNKYTSNRRRSYHVNLNGPVQVDIVYEPIEIREDKIHIYADFYRWAKKPKTELINALIRHGIDLKKIDASRLESIKYPNKRYSIIEMELTELFRKPGQPYEKIVEIAEVEQNK